jgi:hypothetical protein
MLRQTREIPIPKPIMSGLAILAVLFVLGGIYVWDVSRTETIAIPARLEGDGCDADGIDCRLVRGGETKVQLKNCDEADDLCRKERFAISEKEGGVEVYSLKSDVITFIDEEIVIEVAEIGEFLYEQDRYSQVERAAAMATECELPEEGKILGEECYEMELPENLRESETEERRGYVELRAQVEKYIE